MKCIVGWRITTNAHSRRLLLSASTLRMIPTSLNTTSTTSSKETHSAPVETRRSFVTSPQQHFGDISGGHERFQEREREILARFDSPLDRLVLTADGTLQLVVSAWHNRVVTVNPVRIDEISDELRVEREVELLLGSLEDDDNKLFCRAVSTIKYENRDLMDKARGCGIGQMFRVWNLLPTFQLLDADLDSVTGELSRKYNLSAPGVVCTILETFPINPLLLPVLPTEAPSSSPRLKRDAVESKGVKSDARLAAMPPDLSPMQRVFCAASGNVQRLASAALGEQIHIRLLKEEAEETGSFTREVELLSTSSGNRFCLAQTTIDIHDDQMREKVASGDIPLGSLVSMLGAFPDFKLLNVNWVSPTRFSRLYRMNIAANQVELVVREDFDWEPFPQLSMSDKSCRQ